MKLLKLSVVVLFVTTLALSTASRFTVEAQRGAEAPAGFENLTNGFVDQAQFDLDRATFAKQLQIPDGLGPVYNAQSCGECHQNPVTGGISQITELRAGHFDGVNFVDHVGGSLINDRA